MAFWTPQHLATLAEGRWLHHRPPADDTAITGVGIDTRTLQPGHIYVAIRGENHDGHDYVEMALDKGAAFAVVDDADRFESARVSPVLIVSDCVQALAQWAHAYRDVLADGGCQVIAVAGSNGKTTTRHLIHHVLTHPSGGGKTGTQSPKSFNNHLGVPLTLLAAQPEHDFVACEVGTNHPGEVAALSAIVRPDVAVITSIGAEHLEFFGDLEGVAKEEASILPTVQPGGGVFIEQAAAGHIAPHYDVQDEVAMLPVLLEQHEAAIPDDFPLDGAHNRRNAALAVAVGRWLGVNDERISFALRSVRTPEGRMQRVRYESLTVIHDAYNANPDSLPFAFEALSCVPGRKVAVLADMLELGDISSRAHAEASEEIRSIADQCWFVGSLFTDAAPWSDDLRDEIVDALRPGDTVLLKGSRGMQLERILPAIEKRFGPPTPPR